MGRKWLASLCVAAIALSVGLGGAGHAFAATPTPGWSISSLAQPTSFSAADNTLCQAGGGARICDTYVLTITNTGSAPALAPIAISDVLPTGLKTVGIEGHDLATGLPLSENEFGWACSAASARCEYAGPVLAGDTLVIKVDVEVVSATGSVVNSAKVEGGEAAPASTSAALTAPTRIGEETESFGLVDFGFEALDAYGAPDVQAGDHPHAVTTAFHLNTQIQQVAGEPRIEPVQQAKDIAVDLPLGFVGDPRAAARCTEAELTGQSAERTLCPAASRVGTVLIYEEGGVSGTVGRFNLVSAIYNMVPDTGYPAQFGLKVLNKPVPLYANVVHTPSGYALRVVSPGVPRAIGVSGVALTFFGDPNTANGDPNATKAFFANPGNCTAGPLKTRIEADSWAEPGRWFSAESVAYPRITGCNLLQFEPTIEVNPEVTEAEGPSGYEINIKVPQSANRFPALATPELKNVTMTLPAGMTVSPGAADGLVGCEASGPHGIEMPSGGGYPNVAGEGEAIGPDGMAHLAPGHCPQASQIGTVRIVTPLLESPLEGHLYLAQPQCGGAGQPQCTTADATSGRLFGLYLEAEGSGVVVKLAGSMSANPATGQLTARFRETPQLPFSEVSLHIKGGARAPLANPRQCGNASSSGELTPWSTPATPDAIRSTWFPVDWDGNGGACPAGLPFAPTLAAGATNAAAGHFSPFTLTVGRGDRQQDLARLQVNMPPGLLGMLSKVALCEEPQAGQGACGPASQIGTTWVAAGSGPHPLWVSGRVYLTGSYGGSPFGLSIVVPAVAGPFNLGNVVVRSHIDVDPNTSALTITSDRLPQFLDGVPLRIQTLNVAVDRAGFIFNPTNCAGKQISATLEAEQGSSASVAAPFAVEGCKSLPFKPTFAVSTGAATSKGLGASLDVKVTSGAGQANIARVAVSLPKQLPSRLATIQHSCPAAAFASNPASCDPRSLVGIVKATTPVLPVALAGPAYLVSHGGAAFPDLVLVLQGEGVRIDLTGGINISKSGITSSTFASVPDAPIGSFELQLPRGPHSALTSNGVMLCGKTLTMPTTITGQNGAQIKQRTRIKVTGCPRVKKKAKVRKTRRAGRRG